MGGVRNARMIKAQVCCSMGCKWCMAYAYILVCYVIPRASPSELHKHPLMEFACFCYECLYHLWNTGIVILSEQLTNSENLKSTVSLLPELVLNKCIQYKY